MRINDARARSLGGGSARRRSRRGKTAVAVDAHSAYCRNGSNKILNKKKSRVCLHQPSSCLKFYAGTLSLTLLTVAVVVLKFDENVRGINCRVKNGAGNVIRIDENSTESPVVTRLQEATRYEFLTLCICSTCTYPCNPHEAVACTHICSKGHPRSQNRLRCKPWRSILLVLPKITFTLVTVMPAF